MRAVYHKLYATVNSFLSKLMILSKLAEAVFVNIIIAYYWPAEVLL